MLPVGLVKKRCSTLAALIAAPAALLLTPGRAEAILTYNIFESGSMLVLQASGSIDRSSAVQAGSDTCNPANPGLVANVGGVGLFRTGPCPTGATVFLISTTTASPVPAAGVDFRTTNVSGIRTALDTASSINIDNSYLDNTPIASNAIFADGTSLAALGSGFTTPGLIGSWQLVGVTGDAGRIDLVVGAPATASVPGPLPLFGAAAAFGWSRALRRRLRASTPSHV